MRILAIGINYWPEETGIAAVNTGWCEYLAAAGHDVTVCTGFPYYPAWRVTDGYRGRVFGSEMRSGVRVLRSYLYVPRHVTTARRALHEGTFVASSCLRAMANGRPDFLFTLSPPLGLGLSSAVLGALWGIPYVFHVLDLQPDAALELRMLRRGAATGALYA
ncbi:MAG: glycosyltransferase, partial [Candidatus Rokuibacteriota bacterium]